MGNPKRWALRFAHGGAWYYGTDYSELQGIFRNLTEMPSIADRFTLEQARALADRLNESRWLRSWSPVEVRT